MKIIRLISWQVIQQISSSSILGNNQPNTKHKSSEKPVEISKIKLVKYSKISEDGTSIQAKFKTITKLFREIPSKKKYNLLKEHYSAKKQPYSQVKIHISSKIISVKYSLLSLPSAKIILNNASNLYSSPSSKKINSNFCTPTPCPFFHQPIPATLRP